MGELSKVALFDVFHRQESVSYLRAVPEGSCIAAMRANRQGYRRKGCQTGTEGLGGGTSRRWENIA